MTLWECASDANAHLGFIPKAAFSLHINKFPAAVVMKNPAW